MARRIIRGVTKLSEEEKRRQAFSKKQETDTQQMQALLKLVQGTPFDHEVFHVFLKDALTVLYSKAWDAFFKAKAQRAADLVQAAHKYFLGRAMDSVAYASNPANVYWSVFTEIEAQVKAGNHLKDSDFVERQGFLREPPQVTPQQLGYGSTVEVTAALRETNRRRRLNPAVAPTLWQSFLDEIRMRMRRTHPDYDPNPDMEGLRELFDQGFGPPEVESRLRQHLFVNRRGNLGGSVEGLSDPQEIANVRNQNIQRQREELRAFIAEVRTRMRNLHPGWSPASDRGEITRAWNNGRTVDSVVAVLSAEITANLPRPATPPINSRDQVSRMRSLQNRRGENQFIREVLQQLRDVTLRHGSEVDRLNYMRRLYRDGYSVDTAVAQMIARFQ